MNNCTRDPIHLTAPHLDQAIEVLSRAFTNDPMYAVIFPEVEARTTKMPLLWRALLRYNLRYGEVYTTPATNGIAAWAIPEEKTSTLWRTIRTGFGLPLAVARFGKEARERTMTILSYVDNVHSRVMTTPHWHLAVLGVDPECQGQGVGSALIQPILERADADGTHCYLEAMTDANVAFYQHRGFQVVEEATVLDIQVRCMVR